MKKSDSENSASKNWLEWVIFGLSCLLVGGVVTSLVHQALTVGDEPARLMVTLGEPRFTAEQVRIPVTVFNQGDVAANTIEIEVSGTVAGKEQTSAVSMEYVPHRAERKGWVSFSGHELPTGLSARVLGYEEP